MNGPWARAFTAAVGRGDGEPLAVEELRVEPGLVAGRVDGCVVTLSAAPIPPGIWTTIVRFARGNPPLEAAVEGRGQSTHLDHVMDEDWDAPLVPPRDAIRRSCTCDAGGACVHVASLAHAVARAIDDDPAVLLRWRGCGEPAAQPEAEPEEPSAPAPLDARAWEGGELPPPREPRPLPPAAVLKRLGRSRIEVAGRDLADVLERAYAELARR